MHSDPILFKKKKAATKVSSMIYATCDDDYLALTPSYAYAKNLYEISESVYFTLSIRLVTWQRSYDIKIVTL